MKKVHRFYFPGLEMSNDILVNDRVIIHQWTKVLRFRVDEKVILFNSDGFDYVYSIKSITPKEIALCLVESVKSNIPAKELYLFWSLLKKDRNDWVVQKCTELGVTNLVPIIADRSEKTGFNKERAKRIAIEASEQCGRGDIPNVFDPVLLKEVIDTYKNNFPLYVCEQGAGAIDYKEGPAGVLIGPEGGWSDAERAVFVTEDLPGIAVSDYTLRGETAAIVASSILIQ